MRALIINMPTPANVSFGRVSQPLGPAYLAATLRAAGHGVTLIEANGMGLSIEQVTNLAVAGQYEFVGFSSTTPSFPAVDHVASALKNSNPAVFLMAGGHHPSAVGLLALSQSPNLDAICIGEGEATCLETITRLTTTNSLDGIPGVGWRQRDGGVVWNGSRHLASRLDDIPWPARDLMPSLENYAGVRRWPTLDLILTATIAASRGCPYRCNFCDIQSFYRREDGPMRRVRRPETVVEEMKYVVETTGAGHFAFIDDLFPFAPAWVDRFYKAMQESKLEVTFSLAARADHVVAKPQVLNMLASVGCSSVEMGIESGSQSVLDRYQKDLTVEVNKTAVFLTKQAGIRVMVDYIMFDPWTTLDELKDSHQFLTAIGAEANYPALVYSSLTFYPGTPMYQRAIDRWPERADEVFGTTELEWVEDPRVDAMYTGLMDFRREYQSQLNRHIDAWRTIHRAAIVTDDVDLRKMSVDQMFALRSVPHEAFTGLLSAAEGARADVEFRASELGAWVRDLLDKSRTYRDYVEQSISVGAG